MYTTRGLYKLSLKIVSSNIYWLVAGLLVAISCDDNEDGNPFSLTAEKATDTQVVLRWSPFEENDGYKVWRTNDEINQTAPDLIATVDEVEYWDGILPLSTSLSYYITTTVNGKEHKSNTVNITGRTTLNIVPYQVELIPDQDIAVIRDYSSILLLDHHQKIVIKKVDFNGRVGQFDMFTNNGTLEVYIPCSDNNVS
jgi:hypothetical protein